MDDGEISAAPTDAIQLGISSGTVFASWILSFFGGSLLLLCMFGYAVLILLTFALITESRIQLDVEVLLWAACWLGVVFFHALATSVLLLGRYMRGDYQKMKSRALGKYGLFSVLRDMSAVIFALVLMVALFGMIGGDWLISIILILISPAVFHFTRTFNGQLVRLKRGDSG